MKHLALDLEAYDLEPADGGYWATRVTCLTCGHPLTHVTTGAPVEGGTQIRAVAHCDPCGRQGDHILTVVLERC